MVNKVAFFIDGFNLYHSVCEAIPDKKLNGGKWLDIKSLCTNFLSACGSNSTLSDVIYFSAIAHHMAHTGAPVRHQLFIDALESTGVQVILGNFKKKKIKCKKICRLEGFGHEEKETDVNIAVTLFEYLMLNKCDTAVIVSGDSDLVASTRAAKRLFPTKRLGACFPYKRKSNELAQIADFELKISAHLYERFQFPPTISLLNGKTINKPQTW